jgi:7-cyano-7-deazaguanine synthase
MKPDPDSVLVVLSGGQDSATCLAWAMRRWRRVDTITFDYGQRHRIELEAARQVARIAGCSNRILPVDSLAALGGNALTGDEEVQSGVDPDTRLPNTFVPGRNPIFLTLAAAYGYQRGISDLVTGVCQTDYSGYPDCREGTMQAVQESLRQGMEWPVVIHTPLMHLTKAASVALAQEVGAMGLLAWTHTCYNGSVPPCGSCPACHLRARGFEQAGVADPLLVRLQRGA